MNQSVIDSFVLFSPWDESSKNIDQKKLQIKIKKK